MKYKIVPTLTFALLGFCLYTVIYAYCMMTLTLGIRSSPVNSPEVAGWLIGGGFISVISGFFGWKVG